MTWATYQEAAEFLADWAADHPLDALREFAEHLTTYRLDACALAEPMGAGVRRAPSDSRAARLVPGAGGW